MGEIVLRRRLDFSSPPFAFLTPSKEQEDSLVASSPVDTGVMRNWKVQKGESHSSTTNWSNSLYTILKSWHEV